MMYLAEQSVGLKLKLEKNILSRASNVSWQSFQYLLECWERPCTIFANNLQQNIKNNTRIIHIILRNLLPLNPQCVPNSHQSHLGMHILNINAYKKECEINKHVSLCALSYIHLY